MTIHASIIDGPLPGATPVGCDDGVGATLSFEGIVRQLEDGRVISALDYQAYEPMAGTTLIALAQDIARSHSLASINVWHSRGRVPVGCCSFRLVITSTHRKEALRAMDEFIDRLKRDVPIWKSPVWAEAPAAPTASSPR